MIIVNQMIFFDFQRKRRPKCLNTNHKITNDGLMRHPSSKGQLYTCWYKS